MHAGTAGKNAAAAGDRLDLDQSQAISVPVCNTGPMARGLQTVLIFQPNHDGDLT
jgi:hypothetical protein